MECAFFLAARQKTEWPLSHPAVVVIVVVFLVLTSGNHIDHKSSLGCLAVLTGMHVPFLGTYSVVPGVTSDGLASPELQSCLDADQCLCSAVTCTCCGCPCVFRSPVLFIHADIQLCADEILGNSAASEPAADAARSHHHQPRHLGRGIRSEENVLLRHRCRGWRHVETAAE